MKEISKEEEAYRRGYTQGFFNARHPENKNLTFEDVRDWRDNSEESPDNHPPGSYQRKYINAQEDDPAFSQFSPI